jgi:hypothetical protein
MLLHNEPVVLHDRVYDLNRFYGRVVQITGNSIEVQFPQSKVMYDETGTQRGKPVVTLFWDTPYILAPAKDTGIWTDKKKKFDAILGIINGEYK